MLNKYTQHIKLSVCFIIPVLLLPAWKSFCQELDYDYLKALVAYEQSDIDNARAYITQSLEQDNQNPDYYLLSGKMFMKQHKYDKAIDAFQKANKYKPSIASYQLARACALKGLPEQSVKYLQENFGTRFKVPLVTINYDTAFLKIEEEKAWRDFWEKEWYTTRELVLSDAAYEIRNENYELALDILDNYILDNDRSHSAFALRGELFFKRGDYLNAESDFSRAIRLYSNDEKYYACRGQCYHHLEKNRKALSDLNESLNRNPYQPELYYVRAKTHAALRQFEEAGKDFDLYFSIGYDDVEKKFEYGVIAFRGEDYMTTLKCLNEVIEKSVPQPEYYSLRGHTFYNIQYYERASKDFGMVLDLDPQNAEAWFFKGKSLLGLGMTDKACKDFRQSFRLGYTHAGDMIHKYCRGD